MVVISLVIYLFALTMDITTQFIAQESGSMQRREARELVLYFKLVDRARYRSKMVEETRCTRTYSQPIQREKVGACPPLMFTTMSYYDFI